MSVENDWNETLFGCFSDCGSCCYGYWCTPCLFGTNAKKANDQNCCLMCCIYGIAANFALCWIPHMMYREKLRKKYNLKEEPCGDCPTTLCCSPCALCQEAREMKSRANQPGIAYQANSGAPVVFQPGGYGNNVQPGGYGYNVQPGGYGNDVYPGYGHNVQPGGYGYDPQQFNM